jgi:hypothetical protein
MCFVVFCFSLTYVCVLCCVVLLVLLFCAMCFVWFCFVLFVCCPAPSALGLVPPQVFRRGVPVGVLTKLNFMSYELYVCVLFMYHLYSICCCMLFCGV